MTELKAFIQVPVEKELPKEADKYYLTNDGWSYFHSLCKFDLNDKVKWWLKEIPLTELMEEFTSDMVGTDWNYEEKTYKELLTEFLKQKGML